MVRYLRTRLRLSRMILSLTKEARSFVCAASCNNNFTSLTDFHFPLPLLVAALVNRRFYATPPMLSQFCS